MHFCRQAGITDAAFAHLAGIHTLQMGRCNQVGITDAAFAHLHGIYALFMTGCGPARVAAARALGLPA